MAITLNYFLDTRNKKDKKEKEFPVKMTITKRGSTAYLATGITLIPENWKDRRVVGRKDKARLNDFLDSLKNQVRHLLNDNNDKYQTMTATEIKNDLCRILEKGGEEKKNLFIPYYKEFALKRKSNRTQEIYLVTLEKILQEMPHAEKLTLDDIDLEWIEDLDEALVLRGNNSSTRNLDFRNIRAVVKYAHKHHLIQEYPFEDFDIPKGESPDRALTIEQLRKLVRTDVKPWEKKYLDFFILSLLLVGINTEDLIHVEQIENGRINYTRKKTGEKMSIKVEKEALDIIKVYKGEHWLLNISDTYNATKNWTSKVDHVLKGIAQRNGIPPISMYWARHTWASIARNDLDIDLQTVADGLGHKPPKEYKVTMIYIKKKDWKRVDEANRKVIDYIFSTAPDDD